jgi:hypothetical protein
MLNILRLMVTAIGLAFVVVVLSGGTFIDPQCNLTTVLGGPATCDSNIDLNR